jgi:competence protein ComEC
MTTDARLAVPAAIGWALLAITLEFPAALPWAAAACWVLAVVGLLVSRATLARASAALITVLCATLAALMLTSAALAAPGRWPESLVKASESGAVLRGTVVTTQTVHEGETRFDASLASGSVAGDDFDGSVPVLVFGIVEEPVALGTELRVVATLSRAEPVDGAAFLVFLEGTAEIQRAPPWLLRATDGLREGFLAVASGLPGEGGMLLPGLAIGDTSAVPDSLDSAMKASALSHLTAVSGANCAVIIGLVMFGGALVGLRRAVRIAVSLVVLAGFVVLVTPEPSVLRASVMAALVLGAIASGRPARGLPVLAVAVTVLLVFDPWLARNYGFVLSVCATAGLLVLAAPLARVLSRWIPMSLALLIAVPAAAQLACQPVLILLTPSIPTYGVVANVLAAPAAPVATVLGLVACLIIPIVPMLGTVVAQVAWLPSAWIAAVATFFSGLPWSSLPWIEGGWGVATIVVVGLIMLLALFVPGGRQRHLRVAAVACLLLVVAGYAGTVGGDQLRRRLSPPSDWMIAACDVGQGDAVLVRNAGQVVLVDTGPDAALLDECLSTLGVAHLDLLLLTHFDLDHVGGVDAVTGQVSQVLVGPSGGDDDDRVVQRLADAGASVVQVARGDAGSLGELDWRVLWPPGQGSGMEPGNESSVVVDFVPSSRCLAGCFTGVFLGDLGEEAQGRMLAGVRMSEVDVVKVSHHGSRDQNDRLYERLSAAVGLIGVGSDNTYGHPTQQTLALLQATGTQTVRTDRSGLALLSVRDGSFHLWTEHDTGRE